MNLTVVVAASDFEDFLTDDSEDDIVVKAVGSVTELEVVAVVNASVDFTADLEVDSELNLLLDSLRKTGLISGLDVGNPDVDLTKNGFNKPSSNLCPSEIGSFEPWPLLKLKLGLPVKPRKRFSSTKPVCTSEGVVSEVNVDVSGDVEPVVVDVAADVVVVTTVVVAATVVCNSEVVVCAVMERTGSCSLGCVEIS